MFHHRVHKSPIMDTILGQKNPFYTFTSYWHAAFSRKLIPNDNSDISKVSWSYQTKGLRTYVHRKVTVKVSLRLLNKAPRREDVWGEWSIGPPFMTSVTTWRWVLRLMPRPLGKCPQYPLYRRLRGPRAGLNAVDKRKIFWSCWDSNPDFPTVEPLARRYTDWAIQNDAESVSVCYSAKAMRPTVYTFQHALSAYLFYYFTYFAQW
jgi:hypothetical protein